MKQYMTVSNLTKSYGDVLIFENISFSLHEQQKIALIGPNGTGKSTLIKVLAQIMTPDGGEINVAKNVNIGYVSQQIDSLDAVETSLYDFMLEVIAQDLQLFEEIKKLELQFAKTEFGTEAFTKLSNQYEALQEEAKQKGLYQKETKIKMLLTKLGFVEQNWTQPVNVLSGGQKIRLHLARTLLQEPEILLLDEPTNHLDIETIIWLNSYLSSYPYAIILITHDEKLIDSLATNIWQLLNHQLYTFNGKYTDFKQQLAEQMQFLEKQQNQIILEKQKLSTFVEKNKTRATTAKRAQSAQKRLNKLTDVDTLHIPQTLQPFSLNIKRQPGKYIFKLHDVLIGYDQPLYEALTIDIMRYDRVALVGKNGIGKSTLLATLFQQLQPLSGNIEIGHHVDLAYFQQQQIFQVDNMSAYDTFSAAYPDAQREIIYPILARFGFKQEDVHLNNATLSGGEKQRLLLAMLYYKYANTLLLDEPTNHLDIDSKQALIESLNQFDGTIIFASHDRYFIEHVATKIIFIHDQQVHYFTTYQEFENYSLQQNNDLQQTTTITDNQLQRQEQKKQQAQIRSLNREIEAIELEISDIEKEIAQLNETLLEEQVYSDFVQATKIQQTIVEREEDLTQATLKWEELQTKLETFV